MVPPKKKKKIRDKKTELQRKEKIIPNMRKVWGSQESEVKQWTGYIH